MDTLVQKLKAQRLEGVSRDYKDGMEVGKDWVQKHPDYYALKNLEKFWNGIAGSPDRVFENPSVRGLVAAGAPSNTEMIYYAMVPGDTGDKVSAKYFWKAKMQLQSPSENPEFLKGIIVGALAEWKKVKEAVEQG